MKKCRRPAGLERQNVRTVLNNQIIRFLLFSILYPSNVSFNTISIQCKLISSSSITFLICSLFLKVFYILRLLYAKYNKKLLFVGTFSSGLSKFFKITDAFDTKRYLSRPSNMMKWLVPTIFPTSVFVLFSVTPLISFTS